MIDTLPEPLSFSYEPAVGLFRPVPLPTLRRGRMREGMKPDAAVRALIARERWPHDADTLHHLAGVLAHGQERPLTALTDSSARLLERGAEALEERASGDWRARDVAAFARKLAQPPREIARMLYRPTSADRDHRVATRCELCFEFSHLRWRCHWSDTRMALRRLGHGPLCQSCVECLG